MKKLEKTKPNSPLTTKEQYTGLDKNSNKNKKKDINNKSSNNNNKQNAGAYIEHQQQPTRSSL